MNMRMGFRKTISNLMKRDWITKYEGKLTLVQLMGLGLVLLGIVYFASFLLPDGVIGLFGCLKLEGNPTATGVSIGFFITMLGIALAFPDMLKSPAKDISTMRIIVFMFANVICMLLLKFGWDAQTLKAIGLNGHWVGIIAFLFGAKVTQSFMENAGNVVKPQVDRENEGLDPAGLAALAIEQHADIIKATYPNVVEVSDTLKNGKACVTIYLRDSLTDDLPRELKVRTKSGQVISVQVELVIDNGQAKPHIGQTMDEITGPGSPYFGSICCLVTSTKDPGFIGVVTSGHIFTRGKFKNLGGQQKGDQRMIARIPPAIRGELHFQQMKYDQDLAIVKLGAVEGVTDNYTPVSAGYHTVTTTDMSLHTEVTILSRGGRKRNAFILDYDISFEVEYGIEKKLMRGIILIGDKQDRTDSKASSEPGDSGSCVLHAHSGKIVGMLMGGNDKFSFVLPLRETLDQNGFKPL